MRTQRHRRNDATSSSRRYRYDDAASSRRCRYDAGGRLSGQAGPEQKPNKYFQELGSSNLAAREREHQKHFAEAGISQNGRVRRVFIIQGAPDSFGCMIILRSGTVLRCIIEMPLDYLSGISLHRGVGATRYLEARGFGTVDTEATLWHTDEHIDASGAS